MGAGETPALPGWRLLTWAGLRPVPRIVVQVRLYDSPPLSLGSSKSLMASPNMFRLQTVIVSKSPGKRARCGAPLHMPAPFHAEHTSPIRYLGWQTVSEESQSG